MVNLANVRSQNSLFSLKTVRVVIKYLVIFLIAFLLFGFILTLAGKDPVEAIKDTLAATLGTTVGFSEVIVKMIPLLFTAVAVALPARVGLINVGAEGQLYIGALFAAGVALAYPGLPAWALLPLMVASGMAGGVLWAFIPVYLRARGLVNETITTLLMNYIAPIIVSFFVYGPWRSTGNVSSSRTPHMSCVRPLPPSAQTSR